MSAAPGHLLPCPFCGGKAVEIVFEFTGPPRSTHAVGCHGCGAEIHGTEWLERGDAEQGYPSAADAAFAWNLRGGKPGGRLDG